MKEIKILVGTCLALFLLSVPVVGAEISHGESRVTVNIIENVKESKDSPSPSKENENTKGSSIKKKVKLPQTSEGHLAYELNLIGIFLLIVLAMYKIKKIHRRRTT